MSLTPSLLPPFCLWCLQEEVWGGAAAACCVPPAAAAGGPPAGPALCSAAAQPRNAAASRRARLSQPARSARAAAQPAGRRQVRCCRVALFGHRAAALKNAAQRTRLTACRTAQSCCCCCCCFVAVVWPADPAPKLNSTAPLLLLPSCRPGSPPCAASAAFDCLGCRWWRPRIGRGGRLVYDRCPALDPRWGEPGTPEQQASPPCRPPWCPGRRCALGGCQLADQGSFGTCVCT